MTFFLKIYFSYLIYQNRNYKNEPIVLTKLLEKLYYRKFNYQTSKNTYTYLAKEFKIDL
jgi:hypothetical protein